LVSGEVAQPERMKEKIKHEGTKPPRKGFLKNKKLTPVDETGPLPIFLFVASRLRGKRFKLFFQRI
jgi:hypothetical protein